LLGNLCCFHRLYWPPVEMQARLGKFGLRLAEAQFNRHFVRLDRIDSLETPQDKQRQHDEADEGRACPAAARQGTPQPILAAPDGGCHSGGRTGPPARPARRLPPGAAIATASPGAPTATLVVPVHDVLSLTFSHRCAVPTY